MPQKQKSKTNIQSFYRESIPLKQTVLWLILIAEVLFFATIAYRQMVLNIPFGPWPIKNWGLLLISLLMLLPIGMLFFVRLKIEVNTEGVLYRLVPIEFKSKAILATEIDHFEIRQNKHKHSQQNNERGLSITLKSGNKILIPTRNASAMSQAMHRMMKHMTQVSDTKK
jgi:hypothetical protein